MYRATRMNSATPLSWWSPFAATRLLMVQVLLVTGCSREGSTAAPPRDYSPVEIAERQSTIVVPVSTSLARVEERLNQAIPSRLFSLDQSFDACLPAQYTQLCIGVTSGGVCRGRSVKIQITPPIGCQIAGHIDREHIQLSGGGSVINLSVPVSLTADVRGKGPVGRLVAEDVTGSVTITGSIIPTIDRTWAPRAELSLDVEWRNRIGIDVLGQRITLARSVDPMIDKALQRVAAEAPDALRSLRLAQRMQRVWTQLGQPIRLSQEPSSWFRLTPAEVGYSGLHVSDGRASTTITISGRTATFLGGEPPATDPGALPPLARSSASPGFRLFLPILANYSVISAAAEDALRAGKAQVLDIPVLGKCTVTFGKVEIYQTRNRNLAIGITLSLSNDRDWRDLRGTIWLTARPTFDSKSRTLGVDRMRVSADTNSPVADQLVRVINFPPLNELIRSSLRYDLTSAWAQALSQATAALNRDLGHGIRMRGTIERARLTETSSAPRGYYLGLEAEGTVTIILSD
ncbi:DUF4403 family protein [Sphingomonas parva]|uniref:DUF4403 family protein n=1 Tax=Sphingomonas parva TaxID=2555898 RepID=A0A4Y8ZQJ3_9SPHN|nr:DUF4403 family protein [Sphingomonas parva]TFI57552.1 DUF4403 family protein [Sphingomonas parva]